MEQTLPIDVAVFPALPDSTAEDTEVLALVLLAHRGLRAIHEGLREVLEGEAAVVVELLRRDWQRLSTGVDVPLLRFLESRGEVGSDDTVPPSSEIPSISEPFRQLDLPSALRLLARMTELCLVASAMGPWASSSSEIGTLFRQCVDAEDQHLAQVFWLESLY